MDKETAEKNIRMVDIAGEVELQKKNTAGDTNTEDIDNTAGAGKTENLIDKTQFAGKDGDLETQGSTTDIKSTAGAKGGTKEVHEREDDQKQVETQFAAKDGDLETQGSTTDIKSTAGAKGGTKEVHEREDDQKQVEFAGKEVDSETQVSTTAIKSTAGAKGDTKEVHEREDDKKPDETVERIKLQDKFLILQGEVSNLHSTCRGRKDNIQIQIGALKDSIKNLEKHKILPLEKRQLDWMAKVEGSFEEVKGQFAEVKIQMTEQDTAQSSDVNDSTESTNCLAASLTTMISVFLLVQAGFLRYLLANPPKQLCKDKWVLKTSSAIIGITCCSLITIFVGRLAVRAQLSGPLSGPRWKLFHQVVQGMVILLSVTLGVVTFVVSCKARCIKS